MSAAKTLLVIIALLVISNLFLLLEVHSLRGSLTSAQSAIKQLQTTTKQNKQDLDQLKADVFHIYEGGS